MVVSIGTNRILMVIYLLFSDIPFQIFLVQSSKPVCFSKNPPSKDTFDKAHEEEVGFARDVCVELASNLHNKLHLTKATKPCLDLANIRTSSFKLPCFGWRKKLRNDKQNEKVNRQVLEKALAMVQDFNNAPKGQKMSLEDQKCIIECIDIATTRLTNSGAAAENSQLIVEIKNLKNTYCKEYLKNQRKPAAELQNRREEAAERQAAKSEEEEEEKEEEEEEEAEEDGRATNIEVDEDIPPGGKFPLHEHIFNGSHEDLVSLLKTGHDVKMKDKHGSFNFIRNLITWREIGGNTPLHLAVMLGKSDYVELLLEYDAPVSSKNLAGWNCLEEAISYGNKKTVLLLRKNLSEQDEKKSAMKREKMNKAMAGVKDFYAELAVGVYAWIPILLISPRLPSDVIRIWKRGHSFRLDYTFDGYDQINYSVKRGQRSIIFDGRGLSGNSHTYFINHTKKHYSSFLHKPKTERIELIVDDLMKEEISTFTTSIKNVSLEKGLNWRWTQKTETVGQFQTNVYELKNFTMKMKIRREHLSRYDIKEKEKSDKDFLYYLNKIPGGNRGSMPSGKKKDDENEKEEVTNGSKLEKEKREIAEENSPEFYSLPPPPPPSKVTWEEYLNSDPGRHPHLGRKLIQFEAFFPRRNIDMSLSNDFPLTKDIIMNILETIIPSSWYDKFQELMDIIFSKGVPVKFDILLIPNFTAKIAFQDLRYDAKIPDDKFQIPEGYIKKPDQVKKTDQVENLRKEKN